MRKLIWAQTAVMDLEKIHEYIADDSEYYANVLCAEIVLAAEGLLTFPKMGRKVPEYHDEDTREIIIGDYRLIYEAMKTKINILAVVHGARLLKKKS